jgi:hypothetical protein
VAEDAREDQMTRPHPGERALARASKDETTEFIAEYFHALKADFRAAPFAVIGRWVVKSCHTPLAIKCSIEKQATMPPFSVHDVSRLHLQQIPTGRYRHAMMGQRPSRSAA